MNTQSQDGNEPRVRIIHFADPWCWWSWGLEPVIQRLREVYGDQLEVSYRAGGVFDDIDEWRRLYEVDEERTVAWVRESIELTGNPVEPDYLRKTGVHSTYPSCLAFKAAQLQDEQKAHHFFRRMMEVFQVEARIWSEDALSTLAAEVGLDGTRLRSEMLAADTREAFEQDMHQMHDWHVNFLTLVVMAGSDAIAIAHEFSADRFEAEIDRLAPGLAKRSPSDILQYVEKMRGHLISAREIASVFRITIDDARSRLDRLGAGGLLERHSWAAGVCWSYRDSASDRLPIDLVSVSHIVSESDPMPGTDLTPVVTAAVKDLYTDVAERPTKGFHFPVGVEGLTQVGYPAEMIQQLPEAAVESFAGVGYPFTADCLRSGDAVLDIGSGSGTDVLCAALHVGETGTVYGLDITPAMVEKARANVEQIGLKNVQILEGHATMIPLPDASIDVVTSNGVLNLVPNKAQAFSEIFRVLKPGGWLQLADIVAHEDVGAACGLSPQLWADCIGGAAVEADYLEALRGAGLKDLRILARLDYFAGSSSDSTKRITKTFGAESIVIKAQKP